MPTCSTIAVAHGLSGRCLPTTSGVAIARHIREIDRLAEDLADPDGDIAREAIDDPQVRRLQTITGVNAIVATAIIAAIGDIRRFSEPRKLVSHSASICVSGNPVMASLNIAGSANMGVPMPAPCWSRPPGRR